MNRTLTALLAALAVGATQGQFETDAKCRLMSDQNCDETITSTDFSAWFTNYNSGSLLADQNGDELLTPSDFSVFIANYNLGDSAGAPRGPSYDCPSCVCYAVEDIDGDGFFDVVESQRTQNIIQVWRALGGHIYVPLVNWQVLEPAAVVVADFDGDGEADVAFGSHADNSVTLAYGFGNFTFDIDNDNPVMVGVAPNILSAPRPLRWAIARFACGQWIANSNHVRAKPRTESRGGFGNIVIRASQLSYGVE